MYIDQLLALKRDLEVLRVRIISDYSITDDDKKIKIDAVLLRIAMVEEQIMNYHFYHKALSCPIKEAIKAYKKAVKHEFLTQIEQGYSIEEIITFITNNFVNPGLNLDKYIISLRNPYPCFDEGYFKYVDSSCEDTKLVLTPKAKRYLENVANVSLKK